MDWKIALAVLLLIFVWSTNGLEQWLSPDKHQQREYDQLASELTEYQRMRGEILRELQACGVAYGLCPSGQYKSELVADMEIIDLDISLIREELSHAFRQP